MLTPLSSPNSTQTTLTYINLNCTNVSIECLRVTRMRLLVLVTVTVHRHTMHVNFLILWQLWLFLVDRASAFTHPRT